ncbi:MAG: helix-turn-helix domain-containing protein, partial [Bryobacteraceae bacterium]
MEANTELIPAAQMERMMKMQEVILKAMAGKLKWWEAAGIIGVTDRTMRRWRERYKEHGYSGLWDYRKRSPSPKRVPVEQVEQVLQLYREKYFDFNVQHFHEKFDYFPNTCREWKREPQPAPKAGRAGSKAGKHFSPCWAASADSKS